MIVFFRPEQQHSSAGGRPSHGEITMKRDIHDVLESYANHYRVHRLLNDVPPHFVYEVTVDGVRAVCKLAQQERASPSVEGSVLKYVEATTTVSVPHVLDVGDGYFLTEWCADAPNEQVSVTESEAYAMGVCLATLHTQTSFENTGLLQTSGPLAVEEQDTWSETLVRIISDVQSDLSGTGYRDVSERALSFIEHHRAFIDEGDSAVLVHGDFVPSHVSFDDREVSCVVDWEHAIAGPGEFDYARCDLHIFDNPARESEQHREAFRSGYESVRKLPPGSELRRRAYKALIFTYNIRQAFVQNQRNEAERQDLSDSFRGHVFEILEEVEETLDGVS